VKQAAGTHTVPVGLGASSKYKEQEYRANRLVCSLISTRKQPINKGQIISRSHISQFAFLEYEENFNYDLPLTGLGGKNYRIGK
jgi:hypothetical protein